MPNDSINIISAARKVLKEGDADRALSLLEDPILKENPEAQLLAGEIHYKNQNWGSALNCFRRSLQFDPSQEAAQTYVDLILNILGFFHTDQFNP